MRNLGIFFMNFYSALLITTMVFLLIGSFQDEYYLGFGDRIENLTENSTQYYKNARFPSNLISYEISNNCNENRRKSFQLATQFFENNTVLDFYQQKNGQIKVSCGNQDEDVLGEGGPRNIHNVSDFFIIHSGRIKMYEDENCNTPHVAIHETLHVLGYTHNINPNSILFPYKRCNQEVDDYILEDINRLYSFAQFPDMKIETFTVDLKKDNLFYSATIINSGLFESNKSKFYIYADNDLVEAYTISQLSPGSRIKLNNEKVELQKRPKVINAVIDYQFKELNVSNNNMTRGVL